MDIVVASDENYSAHLATFVCSLCSNNKNEKITIHIFDGGISDDTYSKICNMSCIDSEYVTFKRYPISDKFIRDKLGNDLSQDRSLTTYARIFIPDILDKTIKTAVYMDIDAVVLEDLANLFATDMKNYCIAGVKDVNPVQRRLNIGLKADDNYINAGMILWNLENCRNKNIVQRFIAFVNGRNGQIDAMDQGTINGAMQGDILLLPPKYNAMTPFFQKNYETLKLMGGWSEYYSEELLNEATRKPVFVHFTPNMTTRPWVQNCRHPLKDLYLKYREMTYMPLFNLENDKRPLKQKMLAIAYRILPYNCFRSICKLKIK